jgi:hypothetical protein
MGEHIEEIDGPLALVKSAWLDDWYVIERAAHDGRERMRPAEGGAHFMRSARITNADVEGTADEMREVAVAIEARGMYSAKRVGVSVKGDRALLWSPRNSIGFASVPLSRADALAAEILRTLGDNPR